MLLFADISRMEHPSAVKVYMDYEKNMSIILVPKSKKVLKKSWGNRNELLQRKKSMGIRGQEFTMDHKPRLLAK